MLITIRVPRDTAKVFYSPISNPYCSEEVRLCDITSIQQEEEDTNGADALEEAR